MEATRKAGLERADSFTAGPVARYAKLRNFDFGPDRRGNVSLLSPYLRHRLLLEEEVLSLALSRYSLSTVNKFVDEVFWRAYFKGWLQHRPSVWSDYRSDVSGLIKRLESDKELLERYSTAVDGNTGIDCFDAWSKELVEHGYLHNHARMWFASIWVFTLQLPWQLGADFFLRHLLDGDAASNTLSWRWVSGLHTKGKTYLARVSNIANYTDNRFSPKGLAISAPALTENTDYPPQPLEFETPELPKQPYGLLLTEDDCHPESLHADLRPAAIAGGVAIRQRSKLPVGLEAHRFATGAVQDALSRASRGFDVDTYFFEADAWTDEIAEWATRKHLNSIVLATPPVGHVADVLREAAPVLSRYGIHLTCLTRTYDRQTWPLAGKGYFKLKKEIPAIIEALSLDSEPRSGDVQRPAGTESLSELSSSG